MADTYGANSATTTIELVQTKNLQTQNRRKALCSFSPIKVASPVEDVDEGGVETQVGVENIVEGWHLISVHKQVDNSRHIM